MKSLHVFIVLGLLMGSWAAHARSPADLSAELIRIELADVKQELHAVQVNMELLEERMRKQELARLKMNKEPAVASPLIEQKIAALENDLKQLGAHYKQALSKIRELESHLAAHESRLGEVVKLKETLTSVSQAIAVPTAVKTHRVQAGDSLEKIARQYKTTLSSLKQLNQLKSDQIIIGQTLKIPHE